MMKYRIPFLIVFSLIASLFFTPRELFSAETVAAERIASGLNQPLGLFHSRDGSGRLFILEQGEPSASGTEGRFSPGPFSIFGIN